ncbi:hypothetical protein MTBBW1_3110001 [Desulfamplus magnetovallimortis]|uniref:Uncharacterized protein n=1 Tax=Desulfamplus magnetovallimortis TaxID=1246637 RepID=A0A1W1HG08_9BACT|nr:hypothetical protein MTBBW1_3110001 [Desulfamplus magnetovallimortis]
MKNRFHSGIRLGRDRICSTCPEEKLPAAVADHELSNSGGSESLSRRASSIAQGRNGDKSSGGLPLFSAQAVRYDLTQ